MATENQNQPKARKRREMHDYRFALWMDGKGFLKDGVAFTTDSTEAKIFPRASAANAAIKALESLGVNGVKLVEFK